MTPDLITAIEAVVSYETRHDGLLGDVATIEIVAPNGVTLTIEEHGDRARAVEAFFAEAEVEGDDG